MLYRIPEVGNAFCKCAYTLPIRTLVWGEERTSERRTFEGCTATCSIGTKMFAVAEIECVSIQRSYSQCIYAMKGIKNMNEGYGRKVNYK